MTLRTNKDKLFSVCFLIAVFAAMLVFFESAHKLVILDADDWTYIAQSRTALPTRSFWNPARILPEILMPWCSSLAVHIIMPVCKDYISAITIMNGIVLSLFITLYIASFYILAVRRAGLDAKCAAVVSVLFLLMHFWAYRTQNFENSYLFQARDVTCVYYYTIPTLLNASLAMLTAVFGLPAKLNRNTYLRHGLLIAVVYLAIFSNLFSSCVFAIYVGCEMLLSLVESLRRKTSFRSFLSANAVHICIVLLWLVSVAFEAGGERGTEGADVSFSAGVMAALAYLPQTFLSMNKLCLLLCFGLIAAAALVSLKRENRSGSFGKVVLLLVMGGCVTTLFLVLLCAKVGPDYITRVDVRIAILFWFFALAVFCGAFALSKVPAAAIFLPVVILVALSNIICPLRTFAETNTVGTQPEIIMEIDRALVEQAIAADKAGLDHAEIEVLWFGSDECDWPHTAYMADRLSAALYRHGIISRNIDFVFVPSQEFNLSFGQHYGE